MRIDRRVRGVAQGEEGGEDAEGGLHVEAAGQGLVEEQRIHHEDKEGGKLRREGSSTFMARQFVKMVCARVRQWRG